MREMHELEKTIGYEFKNEGYLRTALTHSSYANEMRSRCPYNERQEFLGDAVLSIIVSDYLFKSSHLAEGDLTKLRASIVCEKSLWGWAKEIHLGDYILLQLLTVAIPALERLSKEGEEGRRKLTRITKYVSGGIALGMAIGYYFVLRSLENEEKPAFKDYKTLLQEIVQKNPEEQLSYELVEERGPDHDKTFVVQVKINSNVIGHGEGKSKKAAEQMAAKALRDAKLYAPYAGVISEKDIEAGQNVLPGAPVAKLAATSLLKVKIAVPEAEIAGIVIGQEAGIVVPALGGKTFAGRVVEKGVAAHPLSRSYEVKIQLESTHGALMPGMVAEVSLASAQAEENRCVIPTSLVQIDEQNRAFVWSVMHGKAHKCFITPGDYTAGGMTVLSGLNPGDVIIAKGQQKVCEGTEVTL